VFPAPSGWRVKENFWQSSDASRRENAKVCLDVIASEAKQSILSLRCEMDCFASLAMTVSKSLAPSLFEK
jgi:hypothetical protein